ncbi:MAG: hypothetical protein HC869_04345 [Rhodospirillales bacterium]|nr:hypothetical protein [Rhodospirillales bacterium]
MKVKALYAALACAGVFGWVSSAAAICLPGGGCNLAPEIDARAGIAAMALVAGVAAILYNRARK